MDCKVLTYIQHEGNIGFPYRFCAFHWQTYERCQEKMLADAREESKAQVADRQKVIDRLYEEQVEMRRSFERRLKANRRRFAKQPKK